MVLSVQFKQLLRPMLLETTYLPETRILHLHEMQQTIWFTLDGLVREMREDAYTLQEKTVWFWFKDSFLYTSPGLFNQQPSPGTVQVLEPTSAIVISYQDWLRLKMALPETELLTERIRGSV